MCFEGRFKFPSPYGEEVLKDGHHPTWIHWKLIKFPSPYGEEVLKAGASQLVLLSRIVSVPLRGRGFESLFPGCL